MSEQTVQRFLFINFHIFHLFISEFAVKAKLQVNPYVLSQLDWRKPLISHNDLPMAGGRDNHLEPMDFSGGGVVQT